MEGFVIVFCWGFGWVGFVVLIGCYEFCGLVVGECSYCGFLIWDVEIDFVVVFIGYFFVFDFCGIVE